MLGKAWIEKDRLRIKAAEEALQKKRQEAQVLLAQKVYPFIRQQEARSQLQPKITTQELSRVRKLSYDIPRVCAGLREISLKDRSIMTQQGLGRRTSTLEYLEETRGIRPCEVASPHDVRSRERVSEVIQEAHRVEKGTGEARS